MSQNWTALLDTHELFESRAYIQNMLDSLKTMFLGSSLPASDTEPGQMAVETTGNTINQRNAADSAWVEVGKFGERYWGLAIYAAKLKTMTADAEATNMIRSHIDVEDRGGTQDTSNQRLLDVWVSDSDLGAPSATGNTVVFNKGTIIQTVLANAHYRVLSDASGEIEIDLTVSGAATRYVMACLPNAPVRSLVNTFA